MINKKNIGIEVEKDNLKIIFFLIFFCVLFLISATRKIGIDRDSPAYRGTVYSAIEDNFTHVIRGEREPTFYLIVYVANLLFSNPVRWTFVIYAFIALVLKFKAMYKYSANYVISMFVYISFFFFLHELTTMRAGVSAGLFLLGFDDIREKRFKNYLIKVLIATLFHYSSIIFLLFYFVNRKNISKYLTLVLIISLLIDTLKLNVYFLNSSFDFLPGFISVKLKIYASLLKDGHYSSVSLQRLLFNYFFLMIILFCDIMPALRKDNNLKMINDIFKISVSLFFLTKCLPVLAARISELTSIYLVLLIPEIIKHFQRKEKMLICSILLFLLLVIMLMYIKGYFPFYKYF